VIHFARSFYCGGVETRFQVRAGRLARGPRACAVAALLVAMWGCAGGDELLGEAADASGGPAGGADGGSGGAGGAPGSAGGAWSTGGALTPELCLDGCSEDGMSIVDCNGLVLDTCTGDDRCVNAKCVPNPCIGDAPTESSLGCDFWAAQPTMRTGSNSNCFAIYVVNPWPEPAHLDVDFQGATLPVDTFAAIPSGQGGNITFTPYDPNVGVPPGEVAILFFSEPWWPELCPYPALPLPFVSGGSFTGIEDAIHVATDVPTVAYQILPYGGGDSALTSATLLLPTKSWGTDYLAVSAWGGLPDGGAKPSLAIVAAEDATKVYITPKVAIVGNDVIEPAPANISKEYPLERGQVLTLNQAEELTGSLVQADKPVAVFGGFDCLQIPADTLYCDGSHQQVPPIRALGTEYVGHRHRNRFPNVEETPPWRLVGAVDGTVLTWEPAPPDGAPTTLDAQQVVELWAPGPFVVRSQDSAHPFYLAAYMSGCANYGTDQDCRGDPEWVNVVATDQYLDSYVFFTDPTYPETSLNLVRRPGPSGFFDVYLDCLGKVEGWQDVGDYQVAIVDLSVGDFEPVGNCANGVHRIHSPGAFALTVWGWGSAATGLPPEPDAFNTTAVSYAYPGGIGLAVINDVEVPPVPK
jgi:hypothetical protein